MQESADPSKPRRLRVFICHSSADKVAARYLVSRLRKDGFDPWLDEEALLPGQEWQEAIPMAIRDSDAVVACISKNSVDKEGYLQKEIREALSVEEEKPEGSIFIIPVKLEAVEVPRRLSRWEWADLRDEGGYARLVRALRLRASQRGATTSLPSFRVFLCHWSADQVVVRDFYNRLRDDGFDPWLDEVALLPGQEWQEEIPKTIHDSNAFVVCLSENSVSKESYLQKEAAKVPSVSEAKSEDSVCIIPLRLGDAEVPRQLSQWRWTDSGQKDGYARLVDSIFIIPLKLDDVEIPRRLSHWQWADLRQKDGYPRLVDLLRQRASQRGPTSSFSTRAREILVRNTVPNRGQSNWARFAQVCVAVLLLSLAWTIVSGIIGSKLKPDPTIGSSNEIIKQLRDPIQEQTAVLNLANQPEAAFSVLETLFTSGDANVPVICGDVITALYDRATISGDRLIDRLSKLATSGLPKQQVGALYGLDALVVREAALPSEEIGRLWKIIDSHFGTFLSSQSEEVGLAVCEVLTDFVRRGGAEGQQAAQLLHSLVTQSGHQKVKDLALRNSNALAARPGGSRTTPEQEEAK